jgi:hypothetical protein
VCRVQQDAGDEMSGGIGTKQEGSNVLLTAICFTILSRLARSGLAYEQVMMLTPVWRGLNNGSMNRLLNSGYRMPTLHAEPQSGCTSTGTA